jgi:hypothetical protein
MRTRLALALTLLGVVGAAHRAAAAPKLPDDGPRAPTRKEVVAAYAEDCHATVNGLAHDDGEPSLVSACAAHDTEQNCSPSICEGLCEKECAPRCEGCQDKCAGSCDGCRAKCKPDDKKCAQRCAEKRADCHAGCVRSIASCWTATTCTAQEKCKSDYEGILADCERQACNDMNACATAPNRAECVRKISGLSSFCARACLERGFEWVYSYKEMLDSMRRSAKEDTIACPKSAHCPTDYNDSSYYLESMCAGDIDQFQLAKIDEINLTPESLIMLFNSYYAMYGYPFKLEKWLNDFFYGADAKTWLPPSCVKAIKHYASEAELPPRLANARSRIKAVWKKTTQAK